MGVPIWFLLTAHHNSEIHHSAEQFLIHLLQGRLVVVERIPCPGGGQGVIDANCFMLGGLVYFIGGHKANQAVLTLATDI